MAGRKVLVRVDFNVPLTDGGKVLDDTRLQASLGTLKFLLERGAALILMSHLGRPRGRRVAHMSLRPVAARLGRMLGRPVQLAEDCVGPDVERRARALEPGQILLLENVRFHPEEEANDPRFAGRLAALGEIYINDAFGAAHRAHASTEGIAHHLPVAVSGLLMEKEIHYLDEVVKSPRRPLVAILGGAKVSSKIKVIENLLGLVDELLIGGAMSYTFLKATGSEVGVSLLEEDQIGTAGQLLREAAAKGVEMLLPLDYVVASSFSATASTRVVERTAIPPGWQGMDIGARSCQLYAARIRAARTVVWNGPMGVFEMAPFAAGTRAIAKALAAAADQGSTAILGGGDTAAAVSQVGLGHKMTHISTGGGAALECMGGGVLPGVAALSEGM